MRSTNRSMTVLGAGGWIGSAVVAYLQQQGRQVQMVHRSDLEAWLTETHAVGSVIYAIGLTADFRERPFDTVEAHVGILSKVLQHKNISDLIFLSSTRVYSRSGNTSETTALPCLSSDPSDLYNLSKLLGEALVLQDPRPGLRVIRLSNVVGARQPASTFLGALLAEAQETGSITIRQPPSIAKDYVDLCDVVRLLPQIAEHGKERIYNLGSGSNSSHSDVAAWLERKGFTVNFAASSERAVSFPSLSIERLRAEFEPPRSPFS
jgi:nucleoside-diphosphate-sugar epimerase